MADHHRAAVAALTALARENQNDFPGEIVAILAQVAGNLGSSYALIASRPGSWEADRLAELLASAVGGDEYLPPPSGRQHLTDAKARAIWGQARWGEGTQKEIAAEHGVSCSTVSDIASGRTWAWLSERNEGI